MSFNKKGFRADKQKRYKFNMKGVNTILKHLDLIYEVMSNSSAYEVTEDNVLELAQPLMGRELDHIEASILKGKFGFNKQEDVPQDKQDEHRELSNG